MDNVTIIVKLQAFARRIRDRKKVVSLLETRYEKIYDPNRKKCFYYDILNDTSSWKKPKLLGQSDISKVNSLYSAEESAGMIQRQFRRMVALRRCRMLYKKRVTAVKDKSNGQTYYYNKVTEQTFWTLPEFMGGKLKYNYNVTSDKKGDKRSDDESASKSGDENRSESDSSEEDEEDSSDESKQSETSEELRERRRLQRKYPRSRAQLLIDECEDREDKYATLELNLSGIGANRFSSRIYDLLHLRRLILSNNNLTRLNSDIKFLVNLEVLDLRRNKIRRLPLELEEVKGLKVLLLAHNKIEYYPGNIYRLAGMKNLDLSHNPFPSIPVEVGNMELLKDLHEWEVGVGLFQKLSELNVSYCKLSEWPGQVKKIPSLQLLNLAGNNLESVSVDLAANFTLKYLDLSFNKFIVLPVQFYSLTQLQTLILKNNKLTAFPTQNSTNFKMSSVTNIDLSHNLFEVLDKSFATFPRVQILNISHNKLREIEAAVSVLASMHTLDISHNELEMIHEKLGGCVSLQNLYLHHNRLQDFPAALPHLMNLKILDMRENKLIDPRPTYFNTLLKLTDMNLSHNNITTLPGSLFALSKLQNLDVSHNNILIMPDLFAKLTSLQSLDLSYNRVELITSAVSSLQKLDRLELRDNRISEVPVAITKMKSLRRIDLINNLLPDYSDILRGMTQLRGWNLSGNKIAGEYGAFLKSTDDSSLASPNDENSDGYQPVNVQFLIRKSRKLWDNLETLIGGEGVGNIESLQNDTSTIITTDDTATVEAGFPWLLELQQWSDCLDESIRALLTIKKHTEKRGTAVASAMRALMSHPECQLMMQRLTKDFRHDSYDHKIFTKDILQVLDLGRSYMKCIRDFETLGTTLFYVSKSVRAAELAHLEQREGSEEQDLMRPVIMRSATMATVEEVEAEMDRRIEVLVRASRERTAASRGSKHSASTQGFSPRILDGLEHPSALEQGLSAGAVRMIRELSVDESPLISDNQEDNDERSIQDSNGDDNASQKGNDLDNASELRSVTSQVDYQAEKDRDSPRKREAREMDNHSLRNLAVGDILEDSEFGSPTQPVKAPPLNLAKPGQKEPHAWKMLDLLYDPAFGNPKDSLLFKVAFECYYGLGLALVERADRVTADIRRIEQNCGLISKLDVGQRKGDDMRDILAGYEQHFPKKSSSNGSTATLKMQSLFTLSDMASVTSLESDEVMGNGGEDEASPHPAGETISSPRIPSVASNTLEDPDDSILKSLYTTHASALVKSLMRERRKLFVWAVLVLGCAADLIHLYGWDAVSDYAVENEDNTVLLAGKDLRSAAVGMCLAYSRALQGAELHALALVEIEKVLRLSPRFRTAEVMRLRSLCALGDFPEAKNSLIEVIVRILHKDIRDIKLRNVMKRDVEIGFLMLYIDTCHSFLMKTGYESKEMQRKYDLRNTGLLERPLLSFIDSEHGDGPYNDWIVAKRNDSLQTFLMHKREQDGRAWYIAKKKEVAHSSEAIIAEFKELMENLGPVVIK